MNYYGYYGIKQFILGKLIQFGYMLWTICGFDRFCFKFILFARKETNLQTGWTLGSRVFTESLTCVDEPKNYVVFSDKFLTNQGLLVHVRHQIKDIELLEPFEKTELTSV